MILSGLEIIKRRHAGSIGITPFDRARLNPNSYNVTLADELLMYRNYELDMKEPQPYAKIRIPASGILLQPGTLYLGSTVEHTYARDVVPMLEGRSSIGRLGIFIHATAGFGDVGFRGHWTLEISCVQPVRIYSGVEIAQLYFHTISGAYETYDGGKYQDNTGVQPSMLWKDFRETGDPT